MTDERIVSVTMPKWGLSMQAGKITDWIATEGDDVSVGDDLADIETEKIAGTLEAADAGTLRRIVARVGEDVPVSSTIAPPAPIRTSSSCSTASSGAIGTDSWATPQTAPENMTGKPTTS